MELPVVKSTIQDHIQSSLSEGASVQRSTGNDDTRNLRVAGVRGKATDFREWGKCSRCATHGGGIRWKISARTRGITGDWFDDGRLDFYIGRE